MPMGSVTLTPGVNVELTPTQNSAGIVDSANIRFKSGVPQKLGGWQKYVDAVFSGIPRSLWAWQDLNTNRRLSVATTLGVTVVLGATLSDLTPEQFISDFTPDFSTTNGSADVEVVDPNIAGITTDVVVEFATPISVGGVILSGSYPIKQVTGSDSYIIEAWTAATATVANGGAVPQFDTTSGSSTVKVTLADHAQSIGFENVFTIPTTVGGVTVVGRYTVTDTTNANEYSIVVDGLATSTASADMNGGDARIIYHIASGPIPSGFGYGLGDYGEGLYGLGSATTGFSGDPITATDWTQDNWGEILLTCPEGGGIYYWRPASGFRNLAIIPEGPFYNDGIFVSMAKQQVVAWGSTIDARRGGGIGMYQDPLLVRWCDIGDFFQWENLPENFAREERISTGSRIISGAAGKNRNMLWTDVDAHTMTFNGGDSVYSVNRVGSNCGIIGKHAWAQQADIIYWMGVGNFYTYAGDGVQPLPCTVWDAVFQQLDSANRHRVVAGSNSDFTEIWWWFPVIGGGGEVGATVKFNITEGTWDMTGPVRSAWLDRSVLGNPIGASVGGLVYSHELGFDDDTNPMLPMIQTADFMLDEGAEFSVVDQIWPDFKWSEFGGAEQTQVQITVLCRDAAGEDYREYGPFTVGQSTGFIEPTDAEGTHPRCRQMAMRVESIDTGSFWRLGRVRYRYAPDGRL